MSFTLAGTQKQKQNTKKTPVARLLEGLDSKDGEPSKATSYVEEKGKFPPSSPLITVAQSRL